jgi:TolB-like protein
MTGKTSGEVDGKTPAGARLFLLGDFRLEIAGVVADVATKKNRALLTILAASPNGRATRERLCGLLWADRSDEQARSSLRQALTGLRRELGAAGSTVLRTSDDQVALALDHLDVDLIRFRQLCREGAPGSLRAAATLFRGALLADTALREADFGDWLAEERRRLSDLAVTLFDRLAAAETGAAAIAAARQLLSLDPLRESSHRSLMTALARAGETALALQQYDVCVQLLKTEFGVGPDAETLRLKSDIASRQLAGESAPPVVVRAGFNAETARPERARLAVLPFANLSEDREQQYFADGLTEDLITALAQQPGYFVIARDSAFSFKGTTGDAAAIAAKLGVRHIVGGNVRRAGSRVRVNAHLIDTHSGAHLWSHRYDHELTDIFATQDDIVASIVEALTGRIADPGGRARYRPSNLEALDLVMRGRALWRIDEASAIASLSLFERAIALDPNYSEAYFWLAQGQCMSWLHYGLPLEPSRRNSMINATKAVSLAPHDAASHSVLGQVLMYERQLGRAEEEYSAALKINPNETDALINMSDLRVMQGRGKEAVVYGERALQADPQPMGYVYHVLGQAQFAAWDYEKAVRTLKHEEAFRAGSRRFLAATLAVLGRLNEARQEAGLFMAAYPHFRTSHWAETQPFENLAMRDKFVEAYRLAGLPD